MFRAKAWQFIVISTLFLNSACFAAIVREDLPQAYVDEAYSYSFKVDNTFWAYDLIFLQTGGSLPYGMGISADGQLLGTPTQAGIFEFEVSMYDSYDGFFYEDEFDWLDSQWFSLNVTDPPETANSAYVNPVRITLLEPELLGKGQAKDTLILKFDYEFEGSEDIHLVQFSLFYNSQFFDLPTNDQSLLEEVYFSQGVEIFIKPVVAGQAEILIKSDQVPLDLSGLLFELPLVVKTDLAPLGYGFSVVSQSIYGDNGNLSYFFSHSLVWNFEGL